MTQAQTASPQIRQYARGALRAAGAMEQTPIPLKTVTAAVGLQRESLFDLGDDLPPRMRDIVKRLSGKLLGALANRERTLYVDNTLPLERGRFTEAHELGHESLPWHQAAYFGDDRHTLSPATRVELEREANVFAAELLFGLDRFTEEADAFAPDLDVILALARKYQASAHAALWRYTETSARAVALVGMGAYHVSPQGRTALKVLDYLCVQSPSFLKRFGPISKVAPKTFALADFPVIKVLSELGRGSQDEVFKLPLDTTRGQVVFDAYPFAGRQNFLLLVKRPTLSRRARIVDLSAPHGLD